MRSTAAQAEERSLPGGDFGSLKLADIGCSYVWIARSLAGILTVAGGLQGERAEAVLYMSFNGGTTIKSLASKNPHILST